MKRGGGENRRRKYIIKYLKEKYGANAIEFHDNNFFVSEKRTVEFSQMMLNENMQWWGEGRIDTVDQYKDESLELMRRAGCKMIFFGAESGNDEILKQMDKGGKQTGNRSNGLPNASAASISSPEYSFVLGLPGPTPEKAMQQIDANIAFIKQVKAINPDTEIIIYVYSPVPTEGSDLYRQITEAGFRFLGPSSKTGSVRNGNLLTCARTRSRPGLHPRWWTKSAISNRPQCLLPHRLRLSSATCSAK